MSCRIRALIAAVLILLASITVSSEIAADDKSTGAPGINSQGLGLTGKGIHIAQFEFRRPGKPGYDKPELSNTTVVPLEVFFKDGIAEKDKTIDDHAEGVAGIMIAVAPGPKSVSPDAKFVAAIPSWIDSIEKVAEYSKNNTRAVNISVNAAYPNTKFDGSHPDVQVLDWSAKRHNTLYVVAGSGDDTATKWPNDQFNGLTVNVSQVDPKTGQWTLLAWKTNLTGDDGRYLLCIAAPGEGVLAPALGTDEKGNPKVAVIGGTSAAAPHVTGTVALLQEYAESKIDKEQNWDKDARQHEVMKAVLLNSTDKVKDAGDGLLLGMEKTILRQDGADWLTSKDHSDVHPFDKQLGTGQVNAKRAVVQFQSGKRPGNGAGKVPVVGWDYNKTPEKGKYIKYVFDKSLLKDSYIAVTIAWDRELTLNDDKVKNDKYDVGETFTLKGLTNLDLYLLPKDAKDVSAAIAASKSTLYSTEHIFAKIPNTAEYEVWVYQVDQPIGAQAYAIAWWGVAAP